MGGKIKIFLIIMVLFTINCSRQLQPGAAERGRRKPVPSEQPDKPAGKKTQPGAEAIAIPLPPPIEMGAGQLPLYLPLLAGKSVGLVVNHTSLVDGVHLVDTLLALGVRVEKIFSPEHGFRGKADAGELVNDSIDLRTGVRLVSLYGKRRIPTEEDLADIDVLIFDIQDVGARYYTYIGTLHYVMQSAARYGKPLMILDRPNPNGHYVDGPILDTLYRSFVGMHPVPIVHGMTVGEFARMINGEGWLGEGLICDLTIVPCAHYSHQRPYLLPIPPSPNLPNPTAIALYPSICLFEGTTFSLGRGTDKQFQVIGHPLCTLGDYRFTPQPMEGAMSPPLNGIECQGLDLSGLPVDSLREAARIDLSYVINAYNNLPDTSLFFLENLFFDRLAGGPTLRQQILEGWPADSIRASWQEGLAAFRQRRAPYLLYEE